MDDKGRIREFDSAEQAKEAGFRHKLSPREVDELSLIPESERVVELSWRRFHLMVLGMRKVDVMEKARYKLAIKFMVDEAGR